MKQIILALFLILNIYGSSYSSEQSKEKCFSDCMNNEKGDSCHPAHMKCAISCHIWWDRKTGKWNFNFKGKLVQCTYENFSGRTALSWVITDVIADCYTEGLFNGYVVLFGEK